MPSSNNDVGDGNDNLINSPANGSHSRGRNMIKTLSKLIPNRNRSLSQSRSKGANDSDYRSYKPPTPTRGTSNALPSDANNASALATNNKNNNNHRKSPLNHRQEKKRQERHHRKNVKRYRGFSTSISSLFLDEQVVCASISWCGLLASSRSEYLLDARNRQLRVSRRNGSQNDFKSPSKILGILLIWTVAFISLTYLIWGFGDIDDDDAVQYKYYGRSLKEGVYVDAAKHYAPGVMRISDYNRRFWAPAYQLLWRMVKTPLAVDGNRHLTSHWMDDQELASNLRTCACFLFFCILGLFGRRRRMQSRFAVLKARAQDDQIHFGGFKREKNDDTKREDKYAGACSHTLCGCYPIDRKIIKDGMEYEDEEDEIAPGYKKKHEDSVNSFFSCIMSCCCGKLCKLWCQCFSICALAQEAREVRLLLPPKSQRVDLITHQPWKDYFEGIYNLRISWKEKRLGVRRTWGSHFKALSILSRTIVITFVVATVVIIITEQLNPRAIFSWADACVLLLTFGQSFIVLGIVHGLFHKSDLSVDAVIKFFASGFIIATPMAYLLESLVMFGLGFIYYSIDLVLQSFTDFDLLDYFENLTFSRSVMIVMDVLQAFFIAALIEELCKYYAFRTIEHPDLIFLTGLNRSTRDKKSSYGGNNAYAFSSDNNALISRIDTFDSDYSQRRSDSPRSYRGNNSPSPRRRSRSRTGDEIDDSDIRTLRQKAAAVTTAMISCAIGLACAENFIYVFFLSGSNAQDEMTMLIFRSIFPVHALCAAMQSIGVIQKFLEQPGNNPNRLGVGKIILPAVVLHGSFDGVLMTVNSLIDIAFENAENRGGQEDYDFVLLDLIAGSAVIAAMLAGLLWYYIVNRMQKSRLKTWEISSSGNNNRYVASDNDDGIELL